MTEAELDDLLCEPTPSLVDCCRRLTGDLIILGAGGKMGPSLARLAVGASKRAGVDRKIFAVSRFPGPGGDVLMGQLAAAGVTPLQADLLKPGELEKLPDAANVIHMIGRKFGTTDDPAATWALNAALPAVVGRRFAQSRIAAFSTGNVYPMVPSSGPGCGEDEPPKPVGEYGWTALARERVFEFACRQTETPLALLRVNYAIDARYRVLHDLARSLLRGEAVDLVTGWVNVIWQRDANAIALRALEHCSNPPFVLNVTGPRQSVSELALQLGERLGRPVRLVGAPGPRALLSDPSRMMDLMGPPPIGIERMIGYVAEWLAGGGRSLERPTHFQQRSGQF